MPFVESSAGPPQEIEAFVRVNGYLGRGEMFGPQGQACVSGEGSSAVAQAGGVGRLARVERVVKDGARQFGVVRPRAPVDVVEPTVGVALGVEGVVRQIARVSIQSATVCEKP